MPTLRIILEGDGSVKDVPPDRIVHVRDEFSITCLPGGMESGLPSVALIIPLPDGRTVVAETSLMLLVSACEAFIARHGDPRTVT